MFCNRAAKLPRNSSVTRSLASFVRPLKRRQEPAPGLYEWGFDFSSFYLRRSRQVIERSQLLLLLLGGFLGTTFDAPMGPWGSLSLF